MTLVRIHQDEETDGETIRIDTERIEGHNYVIVLVDHSPDRDGWQESAVEWPIPHRRETTTNPDWRLVLLVKHRAGRSDGSPLGPWPVERASVRSSVDNGRMSYSGKSTGTQLFNDKIGAPGAEEDMTRHTVGQPRSSPPGVLGAAECS